MSVSSRVIRSERHVEIGSLIQRDRGVVIGRWLRRAEEEERQAKRVHRNTLRDELDTFLGALGASLAEADDLQSCKHCPPAIEHGAQRWDCGWSLPELVKDFQLLRLVLLEYLDETLARPLRCREAMAVGLALDEAIAASVGRYVASREQYIQQIERESSERQRQDEETRHRRETQALSEDARRREAFLATLAHELRNPLVPIRNAVHVMQLGETDARTVSWAKDVIERQVQHMARLVEELLEISRITQGKSRLELRPLDLVRLIRDAVEDQSGLWSNAGLTLTLDLPEGPVLVQGDPVRLTQVVGNLLHNATKFSEPDGQVTVQLLQDHQEGRAVVRITDTGIGIEPSELPHLFDTFRQAETSRDRNREGLGLGLAVVKGLVELHGGQVQASSAGPGQGATFRFWLPLTQTGATATEPAATPPDPGRPLRVLVVDDNRDSADSSCLLLTLVGHEATAVYSGADALEAARRLNPEVVLCDIALPGMDGFAVAHALRREPSTATARLIAVSGYGSETDVQRCQQAGFERLLLKPVDPAELQRVLASPSSPPPAP